MRALLPALILAVLAPSVAAEGPAPAAPRSPALAPSPSAGSAAVASSPAAAPAEGAPAALRLPRPAGGEWMGVYLLGRKAGWAYSSLEDAAFEGAPAVKATSRFLLRATVAGKTIERHAEETRWYERRDGGRLLALEATRRGDGGDRTISGRCGKSAKPDGRSRDRAAARARGGVAGLECRFRIEGDGRTEERTIPHPGERLEDAEAVRLAAIGGPRETRTFDVDELEARQGRVRVAGEERVLVDGVEVRVVRVIAEERDGVRVEGAVDPGTGRTLSLDAGAMTFRAEPEARARDVSGEADVFALTRVALPAPLPEGAREVTLVVEGLPEELRLADARQRFEALPDGRVRIRLSARPPEKRARLPVDRQAFAAELAATPAIDADAETIRARARQLVPAGGDAREVSDRLAAWVHGALEKGYGTSSDRASAVLAAGRGDCTEHSILFVALARAAGLPARTVHGLVAAELGGTPALYWHQWAQVWVGEWLDVDPTFGQPVADATHLALGRERSTRAISVMGRLRVVEASGR